METAPTTESLRVILELSWSCIGQGMEGTCGNRMTINVTEEYYRITHYGFSYLCSMIFTASTDKTCGVFDVQTGERIKRFKGHTTFVNSCSPARKGPELLASGSDDGSVKVHFYSHFALSRQLFKLLLLC